jgi:KDO2-lipid IV(A) lauroyltransferase
MMQRMHLAEMRDLALHRLMQALPVEACSAIGAELGVWLGQRAQTDANARAKNVMRLLRPDGDDEEASADVRALWRNIGRTFAEFSVLPHIVNEGRVTIPREDLLRCIAPDPRPVIVCFVHLGNWEVLGAALSQHPAVIAHRRMSAVVAPPTNPARAAIAARLRGMLPVEQLLMGPSVWRTVLTRLRQPFGTVWLAADAAEGGVDAPRLGREPRVDGTMGKIVRLAASTGARVLPVYCERFGSVRFVIHMLEAVEVPIRQAGAAELLLAVTNLDKAFDTHVRRLVSQWYMAIEFPSAEGLAATKGPD